MADDGCSAPTRRPELSDVVMARVIGSVLVLAGGVLLAAQAASWLVFRSGGEVVWEASVADVPLLGRLVLLLAAVALIGALWEGVVVGRWPQRLSVVAGALLVAVSATAVGLFELVISLLPAEILGWALPDGVSRVTARAQLGAGTWATLVAGSTIVVLGRSRRCQVAFRRGLLQATPRTVGRGAVALGLLGLMAWARYQPWMEGSAAGQQVRMAGAWLPLVGPMSLVAVLLLAGATIAGLGRSGLAAPLVAATAGWTMTFAAALSILAGTALARLDPRRLLGGDVGEALPRVGVAPGVWLAFGIGLAAALHAVAVLWARAGGAGAPAPVPGEGA